MENKKKTNRLVLHIKRNGLRYFLGIVSLLIVDYVNLYIPLYTGEITDELTSHSIDAAGIFSIFLKIVLCSIVIALCRFGWRYFILGSSHRVINGLRKDIFAKLETLSQRYFNENKTGDIMSYFTNDLDAISDAVGFSIISTFDAIVLTLLCLYRMMVNVDVTLTLYTLIPMTLIGIYGYYIGTRFDKGFEVKQKVFGKLSDTVQESITAERVVKAFVQEDRQLEYFKTVNDENRKANMKITKLRSLCWPLLEFFIGCAYLVAIVLGGYYCLLGRISVGKFVTFASYINTLVWPMLAFGDSITTFSQGAASMKRLNAVFNEIADIDDRDADASINELKGEIKFDHVSFSYGEEFGDSLKDLSFEIKKGETFAIMGKTGCGKTSIVNLITRMYDIQNGSISLDGHPIKNIPLHILRSNIAYVPQDNFLFSETLKENITFGKKEASDEEIIEACKAADIHDNIMDFPDRYETMLGERGVTLSGGQKQRSSIARAILKDSPIMIMDDSLSAVDTDTEDNILHNLKKVRKGKTTIMIAHRVSTVQSADHILVLEEGKMAELGNYNELMEKNGVFAEMVRKQQLEKQLQED